MNDDDEIAEAYAVQEVSPPKWTSDPPTEPGWYWARFAKREPQLVELDQGGWYSRTGCDVSDTRAELVEDGRWLWWPVPIQPPEAP